MERVKKGMVEPIEVQVPKHGTYRRRALALKNGLDRLIRKEFGTEVKLRIGEGDEPWISWDLPEKVSVSISSSWRSKDPRLKVHKEDPVRGIHAMNRTDRSEEFSRDYDGEAKTVFYDAAPVLAQARAYIAENRKERRAHEKNESSRAGDLVGIMVPDRVSVERDGKTGRYEVSVDAKLAGLTVEQARSVLKAATAFAAACPDGRLWRTPDGE